MLDLHRLLNVRVGQQNRRGIYTNGGTSAQGWTGHVRPMYSAGSSSDNHCMHVCFAAYRGINACQACPECNPDSHMFAWCCIVRNVSILCDRQAIGTATKDNTI